MLGNRQFYHETVRSIIVGFGTLFNDIHVVRKNNSGVVTQSMKVPLAYGPKQKWLTRLDQDAVTLTFAYIFASPHSLILDFCWITILSLRISGSVMIE